MWKYLGGGFIRGVPARNLTEEEARKIGFARLEKSGLYERINKTTRKTKRGKPAEDEQEKE